MALTSKTVTTSSQTDIKDPPLIPFVTVSLKVNIPAFGPAFTITLSLVLLPTIDAPEVFDPITHFIVFEGSSRTT